jgi:hypothetical protein
MASRELEVTARTAVDDRGIHDELLLEQIRQSWGELYDTGFAGGAYHAHRLTGGPLLTADTLGELAAVIWDDWTHCRRATGYAR